MTRLLFAFVFIVVLSKSNASVQDDPFPALSSPKLEIVKGDPAAGKTWLERLPRRVSEVSLKWVGKNVDGAKGPLSAACDSQKFEDDLAALPSASAKGTFIDQYFLRCRPEIETGVKGRWENIFGMYRWRMHLEDHPLVRHVVLHLPGNLSLRGILALKGDGKKRPFVLIRPGIFASSENFLLERPMLMQLFEQGPFNVLMLENSSSKAFIKANPGFTLGGPTEGLENLQIAKMLRDPGEPLSRLVGDLHLFGISLGGNSLFHTAGLDALQGGKPLIQSYFGFCPVVDAPKTLQGTGTGPMAVVMDIWISMRLWGLRDRISSLSMIPLTHWLSGEPYFWKESVKYAANSYPPFRGLSEGLKVPAEYSQNFWTATAIAPWMKQSPVPMFVIASENDTIVPVESNSGWLKSDVRSWKNLGVSLVPQSFHCTIPVAYDWGVGTSLLNGAFLSNSPQYKFVKQRMSVDLGATARGMSNPRISFSVGEFDGPAIPLSVRLESGGRRIDFPVEIPRKDLDFAIGESPAEKDMIERWLHQQLRLEFVETGARSLLELSWKKTL